MGGVLAVMYDLLLRTRHVPPIMIPVANTTPSSFFTCFVIPD